MILRKTILMFSALLVLASQACSPAAAPATPSPDISALAATFVAMNFQAATKSAAQKLSTKIAGSTATPTSKPALYINNTIPCRSGTKPNFKIITTLNPGTVVDMIGKDTPDSAWLVQVPNSPETCWVLAQDASPSGSYQNLQEVTPQPSTQKLPAVPVSLNWPFICSYVQGNVYQVKINLSWTDLTYDANGYRVYRFDTQIADVPATTTSFSDTTNVNLGSQLVYGVEAYNDAGVSPRKSVTINSICTK